MIIGEPVAPVPSLRIILWVSETNRLGKSMKEEVFRVENN